MSEQISNASTNIQKDTIKHVHIQSCKMGKIKTVIGQFVYCHCCFGARVAHSGVVYINIVQLK